MARWNIGKKNGFWKGVSVEDQAAADERIPLLLQTPAAVRFVSCEPLLAPVDLTWIADPNEGTDGVREGIEPVCETVILNGSQEVLANDDSEERRVV